MLNDAEMDDLRWKADLIGGCVPVRPEELRQLLDEIARLRAENDRLRAGRLRADSIERIRELLGVNERDIDLIEFDRCYPPEEV